MRHDGVLVRAWPHNDAAVVEKLRENEPTEALARIVVPGDNISFGTS
jgi:hypothetical protein